MLLVQDQPAKTTSRTTTHTRRYNPASVGIVPRQYAHFDETLWLRSGGELSSFTLAYETYGTLNTERSNAILICHALSGDAHVAGFHTDNPDEKPGWWDEAVGPGKMFDTNRYFVICSNVIGGCQGSTGPSSLAPDDKPYALRFPSVTVADMVEAQRYLIDRLGIQKLFATAGGSMGGMQALQWAVEMPERVGSVLFIASTPRSSAQHIAFNETGRQAIYADANWKGGSYYGGPIPAGGLAVARMMAHITYMSETSLERKFGRRLQNHDELPYTFAQPEFAVESYLEHQGDIFVRRFDANSYLYITKAIDYFDIGADYGSLQAAMERTQADFLVVSFSSDWLYPSSQSLELVNTLRCLNRPVEYHHVDAPFGHDSFLVEVDRMAHIIGNYLDSRSPTK